MKQNFQERDTSSCKKKEQSSKANKVIVILIHFGKLCLVRSMQGTAFLVASFVLFGSQLVARIVRRSLSLVVGLDAIGDDHVVSLLLVSSGLVLDFLLFGHDARGTLKKKKRLEIKTAE